MYKAHTPRHPFLLAVIAWTTRTVPWRVGNAKEDAEACLRALFSFSFAGPRNAPGTRRANKFAAGKT
jgi:hypothetical protein